MDILVLEWDQSSPGYVFAQHRVHRMARSPKPFDLAPRQCRAHCPASGFLRRGTLRVHWPFALAERKLSKIVFRSPRGLPAVWCRRITCHRRPCQLADVVAANIASDKHPRCIGGCRQDRSVRHRWRRGHTPETESASSMPMSASVLFADTGSAGWSNRVVTSAPPRSSALADRDGS